MTTTSSFTRVALPRRSLRLAYTAPRETHVSLRIVRTRDELPSLRPDWERMRNEFGLPTLETEPNHFLAVLPTITPPADPEVALFHAGNRPCAMIIARRSTRRLERRLGYLRARCARLRCIDVVYGGLISDGSPAAARAVLDHLAALTRDGVDCITFNHLPLTHTLYRALTDKQIFRAAHAHPAQRHWRFSLTRPPGADKRAPVPWTACLRDPVASPSPPTLDEYFRRHKSLKSRKNMRHSERRLAAHFDGDVSLERATRPDDIDSFIREADVITSASYQGPIGAGLGDPITQRAILISAAERGELRSYVLRCGGKAIAFQTGIVCRNAYHLQSTAFLPRHASLSPGQVLLVKVLRDLVEHGITTVDYGLGDAQYKQVYGTYCWEEATIRLFARTPRGRAESLIDQIARQGDDLARRLVGRTGSSNCIKRLWRAALRRLPKHAPHHAEDVRR